MTKEELKKTIDIVTGIDIHSEAEATAKEELMSYAEQLQQENEELKKQVEIKNDGFMASINETCEYATILTEFEKWLEEEIKKLKQSQQELLNLNISKNSKIIHIKEFNLRISTNSICLDKLQGLKEGKK